MVWNFILTQVDELDNIIETIIPEPGGWQNISSPLVRDPELHGMGITLSTGSLEFMSEGYWIIKEEYLRRGVDGDIGIEILWRCDECDGFKVYFEGKLDFRTYKEFCGAYCFATLGIIDNSLLQLLKDRQDVDVDLTSNLAYDGITTLTDYAALEYDIQIPSKALHLKAEANFKLDPTVPDSGASYDIVDDADYSSNSNTIPGFIVPRLNNIVKSEIEDFTPAGSFDYMTYLDQGLDTELSGFEIIKLRSSDFVTTTNDLNISFRVSGQFYTKTHTISSPFGRDIKVNLWVGMKYGTNKTDAFVPIHIGTYNEHVSFLGVGENTITFDQAGTVSIRLINQESVWFYILLTTLESGITLFTQPFEHLRITLTEDTFFNVDSISTTTPTPSKIFLIHEAASRIVESVTNNQLKVKSEYYGRTDSEPFSFPADGCNSLLGINNGLLIRQSTLNDGSQPRVFTSFKKCFDSMNALDCVGVGIEYTDTLEKVAAIEPIYHFYRPEIIFIADNINELTRTIKTDHIWNNFNFGFDKFETESTNGLDAIHTKRQYRTPIIHTDIAFEKLCKYIFDGYAIEVTRRKFGITEDWRYDQDIFGLCLKRALATVGQIYSQFVGNVVISFLSVIDINVPIVTVTLNVLPGYILSYKGINYTIISASFTAPTLHLEVTPDFPENGNFLSQLITIYSSTSLAPGFAVEQGNIVDPANLFDPPTVLNYRVSPIHNALKWFKVVMQGVRNLAIGSDNELAELIFSSGVGNYVAEGELASNGCVLEKEVLAEDESLSLAKYFDPISGTPFLLPENVEFTYPLGLNEFLFIKENMYGLIKFRQNDHQPFEYGWIERLEPHHEDGDATFKLIVAGGNIDFTNITQPECIGRAAVINSIEPTRTGVIIFANAFAGTLNDIYVSADGVVFLLFASGYTPDDLLFGVALDTAGEQRYFRISSYTLDCNYGLSNTGTFYCTPQPTVVILTDNFDGTITLAVDNVIEGATMQVYGATTANGLYTAVGSPVVAVPGVNDIIVDVTVYSFFRVGAIDDVCDYGFSNIVNFVYDVCAAGFVPVIDSIVRSGSDIIITGTAVALSTISISGSPTETGIYVGIGDPYTAGNLAAGITLTAAQYLTNIFFKVYSFDAICIYGLSAPVGISGTTTDDNPVFFTSSDETMVIAWTPDRIARYGLVPVFQVWILNMNGQPEITQIGLDADVSYPDTTLFTYHNSGSDGYIVITGTPGVVTA